MEKQRVRLSQLQPKHRRLALCAAPGEVPRNGTQQQPHRQPQVRPQKANRRAGLFESLLSGRDCCSSSRFSRIVTGNNTNNKSESDQEDNDDVNDNDWSYGAEKKGAAFLILFAF